MVMLMEASVKEFEMAKWRIPYYTATGEVVPIGSGRLPHLEQDPGYDSGTMSIFECDKPPKYDKKTQKVLISGGEATVVSCDVALVETLKNQAIANRTKWAALTAMLADFDVQDEIDDLEDAYDDIVALLPEE